MAYSEKDLDRAMDEKLQSSPDFVQWFVNKTKFRDAGAVYLWSRANHPWGRIKVPSTDPETGETVSEIRESETDVLVVLRLTTGENVALHIENKPWNGVFQPDQPEHYKIRAEAWLRNPKYQNYVDYQTVLVAPQQVFERYPDKASMFDVFVPYEDIGAFIPAFVT